MSEPLRGLYVKRFLTTTGFGAHGGSGNESSKEVTIQYYAAIQCYADQLKSGDERIVSISSLVLIVLDVTTW